MPATDKIPDEKDTASVEYCINLIGEVTAKNYKSKLEMIEEAEFQLDYYLMIYGEGCIIYIKNYETLREARLAYDKIADAAKATTTTKNKTTSKSSTKINTTTSVATTVTTTVTDDDTACTSNSASKNVSGTTTVSENSDQTTTSATQPVNAGRDGNTAWGWIIGIVTVLVAGIAGVGGWLFWNRKKKK